MHCFNSPRFDVPRANLALACLSLSLACSARPQPVAVRPNTTTAPLAVAAATPATPAMSALKPPAPGNAVTTGPTTTPASTRSNELHRCGSLDCLTFATAEEALAYINRETHPTVLGVGEIHAQKGHQLKATTTARFARLLPVFKGQARHLVIELWTGRNDCGDQRVEQVRKAQKPVTGAQASTNQSEYLELGTVAKSLGISPHALVPTCEDYQSILAATADDIGRMLELTAKKTAELVERLLKNDRAKERSPYVITYGGALHNDTTPKPGREPWSFAPELQRTTQGRFVELDLVLREQVHDSDSFTSLPWYPYFRQETLEKQFVLYKTAESSFTLIFPEQQYLP